MPYKADMKNKAASSLASLRWAKTTKRERTECGRKAALARWAGHKKAVKTVKSKIDKKAS